MFRRPNQVADNLYRHDHLPVDLASEPFSTPLMQIVISHRLARQQPRAARLGLGRVENEHISAHPAKAQVLLGFSVCASKGRWIWNGNEFRVNVAAHSNNLEGLRVGYGWPRSGLKVMVGFSLEVWFTSYATS